MTWPLSFSQTFIFTILLFCGLIPGFLYLLALVILQSVTEENNARALQEAETDDDLEEVFLEEDEYAFEMDEKEEDFLTLLIQLKPQERHAIYEQLEDMARKFQHCEEEEEPELDNVVWLRRG
ncbi:MAG: hypothetical protein QGI45_03250 [Myxococcota bacterium]|nr:hypothetical protein [Myxococcota bacterium]